MALKCRWNICLAHHQMQGVWALLTVGSLRLVLVGEKTSFTSFTTGLRHDGHQRVLFVVGAGIVHASLSSRNQWTNAELKQYQHLQVHDENRRVAATAGPIVILTFVINICRYERFRTSKHVRVDGNKKFIAVNSVPAGTSHGLRISFWVDLS